MNVRDLRPWTGYSDLLGTQYPAGHSPSLRHE